MNSFDIFSDRYQIRFLKSTDDSQQYCQLLNHLTESPPVPQTEFQKLLAERMTLDQGYLVLVAEDQTTSQLVASVTLLIEQKLIHGGSQVAHIEDVVVHPDHRGQGLARKLLSVAKEISQELGCYKVILDCHSDMVDFYLKNGYTQKGAYMRLDLE